jgi:peptide/nickel transport system substrate-binding protein
VPNIKRIVFKVIPDEATRLAALKRGEVDLACSIRGELAAEVEHTPGLFLKPTAAGAFWLYFPGQWDPKSPWHDERVRLAAKLAIDRKTINQALTLGHSLVTGSIIPESFDFYWAPPPPAYDPTRAKQLLADAGYPNGFDAGFYTCDASYSNLAEAVLNHLGAVGIRAKLRPMERAAFIKGYAEKKYGDIIQAASGAFGNAATRLEAFVVKGGTYAYGSYPDIDALFPLQAKEMNSEKRKGILHSMQRLVDQKTMYVPIWQLAFLSAVGPRVGDLGFGAIKGYVYPGPYEDMTLKGN